MSTSSNTTTTTTTNSKDYRICNVLGGLDVTRLVSTHARTFFSRALGDVELMREFLVEAVQHDRNRTGDFTSLAHLGQSLDWQARNVAAGTTTVEAGLAYVDDRIDRRIDRSVSLSTDEPLVGSKEQDFLMLDHLSPLLPWMVDRQSRPSHWWKDHFQTSSQNSTSNSEPLPFDALYTAGWATSYGGATLYYPPLNVYGHPLTLLDVIGPETTLRDMIFTKATYPEQNPQRQAIFTTPYPDVAVPGLSLISAVAPVYLTNVTVGPYYYPDTYIAGVGLDIATASVSSFLDVLQDSLTAGSFGLLVDSNTLGTIVISQTAVDRIYPERTGMEETRVTYDVDGVTILEDRRNQPYWPSDTILQDLTRLSSANWTKVQEELTQVPPGGRGTLTLPLTLTGTPDSADYHVLYEKWQHTSDWTLLVLVPQEELERSIQVGIVVVEGNKSDSQEWQTENKEGEEAMVAVNLEGQRGSRLAGQGTVVNSGTMDVRVHAKTVPGWVMLDDFSAASLDHHLLRAGESLNIGFTVDTANLDLGTQSSSILLDVQDAEYPDCFYNQGLSLPLSIRVLPINCGSGKVPNEQGDTCVCSPSAVVVGGDCLEQSILVVCILVPIFLLAMLGLWWHNQRKRRAADRLWKIDRNELEFEKPEKIIGMGAFGAVTLASFRGTHVAVKRIRYNKRSNHKASKSSMSRSFSQDSQEDSADGMLESGLARSVGSSGMASSDGGKKSSLFGFGQRGSLAFSSNQRAAFIREMRVLSTLRHPQIVTIMGAVMDPMNPMIVMEYMENGSLFDTLHNNSVELDGELMLSILKDFTKGMQFLHHSKPLVIHGDIKAQNVLVDLKFRAKIADFGLTSHSGRTGTPYWMAPELLRRETSNTIATDVYSIGILLWEMYSRKDPYEGEDSTLVLQEVADPKINKRPAVPTAMPSCVAALMHDCLLASPEERPSLEEIASRVKRFQEDDVEPIGLIKKPKPGEQSFDLLLKMFPRHIAEALRDGRQIEPEHHDNVCVFFSDIVSFTTTSQKIGPSKVAVMLDNLFHKFDSLADSLGIYKVETVGDAWMGVSNCVADQSTDFVKRIAEFALGAVQAASETLIDEENPELGYVQIRCGFNSGPVLANVVGTRNPHYSLFGDTVNTASRMESNSKPGCVHCSEHSAKLLREQASDILVRSRGPTNIKGKGVMKTYWVERATSSRGSTNIAVPPLPECAPSVSAKKEKSTTSDKRKLPASQAWA